MGAGHDHIDRHFDARCFNHWWNWGPRKSASGQTWATFLRNHGKGIWAADFLPVTDLLFRTLYAFFVIEIASR